MNILSNTPLRSPPSDYAPPNSAHWFTLFTGLDAGKKLFYYDYTVGEDEPKTTVVFVHGNPESSYTYRHIRDELLASNQALRIIAMDHIGFGLSDRASFEMVDMHHSENLSQLIESLNLFDVTLAVHDWGGPIGLGAFCYHPERVINLIVMNTTIFPMPSDGFTYQNYPISWFSWCKTPYFIPDSLWGGVAGYVVSHAKPQNSLRFFANVGKYLFLHAARLITPQTPEYVWSEQLRCKENAKSSKRNVLQTPLWGHGYRYIDPTHGEQDNHDYYLAMTHRVRRHWGPSDQKIGVCGFFGQWDACGKDSVIAQWHEALPQMREHTYKFKEVGHFIEEYKGSEIAAKILEMNGLNQ